MTEIKTTAIPRRQRCIDKDHPYIGGAKDIYDDANEKNQETINSELIQAVGTGGSVDSRIAAAVNVEKTRAEGAESTLTTNLGNEVTRATNAENALDGRVDTLEDAVGTGGSVDSRISAAVATETTRAQGAESNLSSGKADKATTLAGYGITDAYTKSETYTKTEVNGLVDTPHQEYVTVDAYANLPATGSKDTIYRVSNYNGSTSQVDASVYSEYAWDGTQYVFLCVKSQIGEVFDISVYNNNAKYADLAAALNGGANIPQSLQKGGMSVKFVQSSDNKYVQVRCMAQNFTTDVTQWAIDDAGVYVDSPEFVYVKLDAEDKILWAIKADGSIYYGAGCPQQIKDYIEEKISSLSLDEYESIVAFLSDYLGSDTTLKIMIDGINAQIAAKVDKEEDKSLIPTQYIQEVENSEFVNLEIDAEGKVIKGIKKDGTEFTASNQEIEGNLTVKGDVKHSFKNIKDCFSYNKHLDSSNTLTSGGTLIVFKSTKYHKLEIINNSNISWKLAFSKNYINNIAISWVNPGIKYVLNNIRTVAIVPSDAEFVILFTETEVEDTDYPVINDLGEVSTKRPIFLEDKLLYVSNKCLRHFYNVGLPYHYPNEELGFVGSAEVNIRPLAWIIYTSALLLDMDKFDEDLAGCSKEEVEHQIHRIASNLVAHHKANVESGDTDCWGYASQNMWWASSIASAMFLCKDLFSDEEIAQSYAMIKAESDNWLGHTKHTQSSLYWKNENGETLHPGDTKGEEVSWRINCFALAYLLNVDPEKTLFYETEMVKMCIVAFSKPSDANSLEDINGCPLSILAGSNIREDGLVVNHYKYSPEYQPSYVSPLHTIPVFSKLNSKMPISFLFNADYMAKAMTDVVFDLENGPGGPSDVNVPYIKPGGTMYKPGRQEVYYPNGFDWGSEMYQDKVFSDITCMCFGLNPKIDYYSYAKMHVDRIISLQDRYETGRVFVNGATEYKGYDMNDSVPYIRETVVSMYLSLSAAYLYYPIKWSDDIMTDVNKLEITTNESTTETVIREIEAGTLYSMIYVNANNAVISISSIDSNNEVIENLINEQSISGKGKVQFTPTNDAAGIIVTISNGNGVKLYLTQYLYYNGVNY